MFFKEPNKNKYLPIAKAIAKAYQGKNYANEQKEKKGLV